MDKNTQLLRRVLADKQYATWTTSRDQSNLMLLLTNCEVNTAEYSDCSFKYEPNEMRSVQESKVGRFSLWNKQLVNKSFTV